MIQASIIALGALAMVEVTSGHGTQLLQPTLRYFKSYLSIDFLFIDITC